MGKRLTSWLIDIVSPLVLLDELSKLLFLCNSKFQSPRRRWWRINWTIIRACVNGYWWGLEALDCFYYLLTVKSMSNLLLLVDLRLKAIEIRYKFWIWMAKALWLFWRNPMHTTIRQLELSASAWAIIAYK